MKQYIYLFYFFIVFHFLYAMKNDTESNKKLFGIVVLLEKDIDTAEEGSEAFTAAYCVNTGAVLAKFFRACRQEVPMIVTGAVLNILQKLIKDDPSQKEFYKPTYLPDGTLYKKVSKNLEVIKKRRKKYRDKIDPIFSEKWLIFTNKYKDFYYLIPRSLFPFADSEVFSKLKAIPVNERTNVLEQAVATEKISLDNLIQFFSRKQAFALYLIGHGLYDKELVQGSPSDGIGCCLPMKNLQLLLVRLYNYECKLALLDSCYIGGRNALWVKHSPSFSCALQHRFPVILRGSADTLTFDSLGSFKKFFLGLAKIFRDSNVDEIDSKKWKKVLAHVTNSHVENVPSLYFKGQFRPLPIDGNTVVIEHGTKDIDTKLKNILLASAIVTVPIERGLLVPPQSIVSIIPGKAHHYIDEVDMNMHEIDNLIRSLTSPKNVAPKAYLIKKLKNSGFSLKDNSELQTGTLKNCLIFHSTKLVGSRNFLNLLTFFKFKHSWYQLYLQDDDLYYQLPYNEELGRLEFERDIGKFSPIFIKLALLRTIPNPLALEYSTNGQETEDKFNRKIREIFPDYKPI